MVVYRKKRGGDGRPEGEPEGLSDFARAMYRAEPYFRAVGSVMGGTVLGVAAGYFADEKFGTKPWLLVAGSMLGMAAGMYGFFKAVAAAEKARRGG